MLKYFRMLHIFVKKNKFWFSILTLYLAMSQNGQTHFEKLAANAAEFSKCVWTFYGIVK